MKNLVLNEVDKYETLQEMVINSAKKFGDKLALEDLKDYPIKSVSYNQLMDFAFRFGKSIENLGISQRDKIALIGENRVQWGLSYLAINSWNFVVVPIDKALTEAEILNIIYESEAKVVVFSSTFEDLFAEKHNSLKNVRNFICMDKTTNPNFLQMKEMIDQAESIKIADLPKIDAENLTEIIFTSGSLGHSKGVMLSQKNIMTNIHDMLRMLAMYPTDRFLSVLPIHHTYECTCGLLCPLYSGSSVHYSRSLKTVVEDLMKVKATILLGVPLLYDKMFKRIMKTINEDKVKSKVVPIMQKATNLLTKFGINVKRKIFTELHEKFGGSIRIFIAGGAAPDPKVAKGLRDFGFSFLQGYGLTETSPILTLNRIDDFKDDAAGLPLPSVQIKINNPNQEGHGEIFAKAPSVMLGYYKNPELTAEVIEDGWFKTGDIGYIDEDGFLHINGRKKNVIISKSGKNVFPEEIEEVLNRSDFILESVIVGANDEKQGEIILAQIFPDSEQFIEYAENFGIKLTEDVIYNKIKEEVEIANQHLASFKKIQKFIVREKEFEKTTTQKIKRHLVSN